MVEKGTQIPRWSLALALFLVLIAVTRAQAEGSQWAASLSELSQAKSLQRQVDLVEASLADGWADFLGVNLSPQLRQSEPARMNFAAKGPITFKSSAEQVRVEIGDPAKGQYRINGRTVSISGTTTPAQLVGWLTRAIAPKANQVTSLNTDQKRVVFTAALAIVAQEQQARCDQQARAVRVCGLFQYEVLERRAQQRLYGIYDRNLREVRLSSVRRSRAPASADQWIGKVRGSQALRLVRPGESCVESKSEATSKRLQVEGLAQRSRDLRNDIKEAAKISDGEEAKILQENLEELEKIASKLSRNELAGEECGQQIAQWTADELASLGDEFIRAREHLQPLFPATKEAGVNDSGGRPADGD